MSASAQYGLLLAGLRTLCTVLGTGLHTLGNTLCIECTTDDVVTNTREILNTAASDQNNAVLLKVMAYTGDVRRYFDTVGQSYSGDLSDSGVRLLRGSGLNSCANASLLGRVLVNCSALLGVPALQQCRSLCFLLRNFSSLTNQLVKRWQFIAPPCSKNIYVYGSAEAVPINTALIQIVRKLSPVFSNYRKVSQQFRFTQTTCLQDLILSYLSAFCQAFFYSQIPLFLLNANKPCHSFPASGMTGSCRRTNSHEYHQYPCQYGYCYYRKIRFY